jgi:hypothetical protein
MVCRTCHERAVGSRRCASGSQQLREYRWQEILSGSCRAKRASCVVYLPPAPVDSVSRDEDDISYDADSVDESTPFNRQAIEQQYVDADRKAL